jgi:hypothetical protein
VNEIDCGPFQVSDHSNSRCLVKNTLERLIFGF